MPLAQPLWKNVNNAGSVIQLRIRLSNAQINVQPLAYNVIIPFESEPVPRVPEYVQQRVSQLGAEVRRCTEPQQLRSPAQDEGARNQATLERVVVSSSFGARAAANASAYRGTGGRVTWEEDS